MPGVIKVLCNTYKNKDTVGGPTLTCGQQMLVSLVKTTEDRMWTKDAETEK